MLPPAQVETQNPVLRRQQLQLLYSTLPFSLATTLVLSVLTAVPLWPVVAHSRVGFWIAAQACLCSLRVVPWLLWKQHGESAWHASVLFSIFRVTAVLAGAFWGSLAIFCYPADLPYQVFIAFVIAGVSAGAVASLHADRLSAQLFATFSVLPIAVQLLQAPGSLRRTMGVMILAYIAFLSFNIQRSGKQIIAMIQLRIWSEELQSAASIQYLRLRNVLDSATRVAIIATDLDGVVQVFNSGAELMLGYRAQEMIGKRTALQWHVAREIEQRAAEIAATYRVPVNDFAALVYEASIGKSPERRWTYVRADGSHLTVNLIITAARDEAGELIGFLCVATDITAQLRAEEERSAAEQERARLAERIELATHAGGIGVWELDLTQGTLEWDRRMFEVHGLSAETHSMTWERWLQLIEPSDRGRMETALREDQPQSSTFDAEYRVLLPHASVRHIKARAHVQRNPQGHPLRLIGVSWDVTELKRVDRMKSEFVSTVSHELRTPLTSLRGSLGLLAGGALAAHPDRSRAMIELAARNADRLALLIDDLLDLEKMEAGKMRFEIVTTDLAQLIRQCLDANDGLARSYEVRFVLQQCVDARVNADPYRLQQVLANLLSNAAKFSPRGAEVHIAMHAKPDAVRVEVSDRGPGVPEEFRGRLFEKFSQADSSDTRSKGGTGLGLAVCKAIIDALGGTIGYRTSDQGGATFFFELLYAR